MTPPPQQRKQSSDGTGTRLISQQDYILTPYIAELINTLTNVTYRTCHPSLRLLSDFKTLEFSQSSAHHVDAMPLESDHEKRFFAKGKLKNEDLELWSFS